MIARRFSALGWVAGVASAATGLYLVSLQVAAERAKLEAVEHRIASTQREMRQLQTELGTRASLRQLEKWNAETLSLAAPKAGQFLKAEYQLASLDRVRVQPTPATMVAAVAAPATTKVANIDHAAFTTLQPSPKPEPPRAERTIVGRTTLAAVVRAAAAEDHDR